ncbi:hypothetical protein [Pedobacter nototheniae]|uniref:hypothetical protein n=1 Tax=Pedobacter nototheniae TaxID=2488994 RepID=UPI0029305CA6|nr:hypothetical protein [Pedobacter nototheniae]
MKAEEINLQYMHIKNQSNLAKFFIAFVFFFSFISLSNLSYSVQPQKQHNQTEYFSTKISANKKCTVSYLAQTFNQVFSLTYLHVCSLLALNKQITIKFINLKAQSHVLKSLKTQLLHKIIIQSLKFGSPL